MYPRYFSEQESIQVDSPTKKIKKSDKQQLIENEDNTFDRKQIFKPLNTNPRSDTNCDVLSDEPQFWFYNTDGALTEATIGEAIMVAWSDATSPAELLQPAGI